MAAMETYFKKGTSEFKKGTRVVLNADLAGIPAGSTGKVGRAIGFTPKRYRVAFDDGTESMSVTHGLLVPAPEWDDFVADREKAVEAAAVAAAVAKTAPAVSAPAPEASSEDGDPRLAALMAKSKAAKAAKGVGDEDPPPASTSEPAPADEPSSDGGDPRLAALMAKSKAAKAAKGITDDGPAAPGVSAAPEPPKPATGAPQRDDSPLAKPPTLDADIDPTAFPAGNRVQELLEGIRSRSG
jgi:hypothetical protein